jgi:hypothetical protein
MQVNRTLTYLGIYCNNFGTEGAAAMGNALKVAQLWQVLVD